MHPESCPRGQREHRGGCHGPAAGRLRGFIQPRILLHLLQEPGHGYLLMERLRDDPGMSGADPGLVYRTLRQMEAEGLLRSQWDTEGQGAARRSYEVTDEGVEVLHTWATRIDDTRKRLDRFMNQYHTQFGKE